MSVTVVVYWKNYRTDLELSSTPLAPPGPNTARHGPELAATAAPGLPDRADSNYRLSAESVPKLAIVYSRLELTIVLGPHVMRSNPGRP